VPINWRFFVPKFVDIELGLLELFENVTGVRFFLRHSVDWLIDCEQNYVMRTSAIYVFNAVLLLFTCKTDWTDWTVALILSEKKQLPHHTVFVEFL